MRTTTVTEAKNGLSALLDQVKAGESIVITERGVPVAVLEPVTSVPDATGRLARLARTGVLRTGSGGPSLARVERPGPIVATGASVVQALLEERRAGR